MSSAAVAAASAPPASVPTPAIAQTPEHLKLADALVAAAHTGEQQMRMVPQIIEMIMPLMLRGNEDHAGQVKTILTEEMTNIFTTKAPDMVRVARDAYARHLTDQELRDVTAFYGSTTGQRLVVVQPQIASESMAEGQEIGQRAAMEAMPRIIARMQKANLKVPGRT